MSARSKDPTRVIHGARIGSQVGELHGSAVGASVLAARGGESLACRSLPPGMRWSKAE